MSASVQPLGFGLPPALRATLGRLQERHERTLTDRSLARRLEAAMKADAPHARGLAFYVHDGAIAVYGDVPDDETRADVLAVASAQPGARRIVDHLHIASADS